jgi:hypothetical protein
MGLSREIATLEAASVSAALGGKLTFERDCDDLDSYAAAIFTVEDVPLALQLYDNSPTGDFTLITMAAAARDRDSLEAFLAWSGLPASAVALGAAVIVTTIAGAVALSRFIARHGDEIGEARFDTRNKDDRQA